MGRGTMGVRGITLVGDDVAVDMLVLREGFDILTVSELGYGKRSDPEDYRLQSRSGKGIKAGVFNEKTGALVNMKLASDLYDVMLVTSAGIIIRMHLEAISKIGRATRGVRLMNVREGIVATIAVTDKDEEAEVEAPEETAADLAPEDLVESAEDAAEEAKEAAEEIVPDDPADPSDEE